MSGWIKLLTKTNRRCNAKSNPPQSKLNILTQLLNMLQKHVNYSFPFNITSQMTFIRCISKVNCKITFQEILITCGCGKCLSTQNQLLNRQLDLPCPCCHKLSLLNFNNKLIIEQIIYEVLPFQVNSKFSNTLTYKVREIFPVSAQKHTIERMNKVPFHGGHQWSIAVFQQEPQQCREP